MVKISEISQIGLGEISPVDVLLGTDSLSNSATRNFSVANLLIFLTGNNLGGTPATSATAGNVGTFAYTSTHLYICTGINTWRRVAISAF
jgi:hypothetical protein